MPVMNQEAIIPRLDLGVLFFFFLTTLNPFPQTQKQPIFQSLLKQNTAEDLDTCIVATKPSANNKITSFSQKQ